MTLNQALLNMHFAVANGKGVQLDAEQTAAVLARIESQSAGLERLHTDLDALSRAVGQACVAASLSPGETLVNPIPHVIVSTVVRLREEASVAAALHRELNDLFGWGDESLLHASLHVRNAVTNLRCDLRAEKFLRENADRITASEVEEERAAVVAWLREPGEYVDPACARLADCIERGVHRKEPT